MALAKELNEIVNEAMFREYPNLVAYLEAYSALEIHVMVRFGRWEELLAVALPADEHLMLYRTAAIRSARALAHAMRRDFPRALHEADHLDRVRRDHGAATVVRVLHNNSVAALLAVDAVMVRGEIAYRQGRHDEGLALLRRAVDRQDRLNYDEPWGKMQPIRHALGGLLVERGQLDEAALVFRKDLDLHPRNPWALVGLIQCLKKSERREAESNVDGSGGGGCRSSGTTTEISALEELLHTQRQTEWADYNVLVACECCVHPD